MHECVKQIHITIVILYLSPASGSLGILKWWQSIIISLVKHFRRSSTLFGRWWSTWCRTWCLGELSKYIHQAWTSPSLNSGCLEKSGFGRCPMPFEFTHDLDILGECEGYSKRSSKDLLMDGQFKTTDMCDSSVPVAQGVMSYVFTFRKTASRQL